jgi:hypothetical protein
MLKNLFYYKNLENRDFLLSEDVVDRFIFLDEKRKKLLEGNYAETERGYSIVFNNEFSLYEVFIRRGDIWVNGDGVLVRVVSVKNGFVKYRMKGSIFGRVYGLNKWSFLRIFERV